ncbi:MAG: aminotransferase class IV [Eubacteriaceae bacterium]
MVAIEYISVNGKLTKNCFVPLDEGYIYGYGLFETIKVYNKKIFFFHEHMQRFLDACKVLDLDLPCEIDCIKEYCYELINKNKLADSVLRISLSKGKETNQLFITSRNNVYLSTCYEKGFHLDICKYRRNEKSLLVGIKSNNYLENLISLRNAKSKGYDETIFLNTKDNLCEGSMSNIFFIKNKKVYTPATDCGLLPGIMREKIIDTIVKMQMDCEEGYYKIENLLLAEEVFICNSIMEIMPVSKIIDSTFRIDKKSITNIIISKFKEKYYYNE